MYNEICKLYTHNSSALHLQNWQQGMLLTCHGHTLAPAHFKQLHETGKSLGSAGSFIISGISYAYSSNE